MPAVLPRHRRDRLVPPARVGGIQHPGPAGTDKAAAEQKLLDQAMEQYPHLFTKDRIWLPGRNFPGTPRIARLIARTYVLIRLKSNIPLTRVSPILGTALISRISPVTASP